MNRLIFRHRYFLIPYLVFVVISILLLILFSKTQIHIELNRLNTPFFDQFFKRVTFLGDGLVYLLLLAILLLYSFRWSVIFTSSVVFSNLLVFIGKKILFTEAYRPSKYFELYENYQLHLVEGISLHSLNSFPSGHTTTAFTIFVMMAFLVKNNYLKFLCFFVALLAGYSRIYLSQHFLVDVLVGSVIGIVSVLLSWYLLDGYNPRWFGNSLLRDIRKRRKRDVPVIIPEGTSSK